MIVVVLSVVYIISDLSSTDLLQCTNEPNVSIPQMADLLIERTQQSSWVVVFKSLVSIHNLMNYGNEVSAQANQPGQNRPQSGPHSDWDKVGLFQIRFQYILARGAKMY